MCRSHGCGCDIFLTLRLNQEEDKFSSLGHGISAFLSGDQRSGSRRRYLLYHI